MAGASMPVAPEPPATDAERGGDGRCGARARRLSPMAVAAGAALCWGIAGLSLWAGAALVCPQGDCRVPAFDRQILAALNGLQRPWLDAVLAAATWLGSIAVLMPAALALAWWHRVRGRIDAALLLPVAVGGAWLLAHAGKAAVSRPRPDLHPALIAMPADLSFPSAHALQITAFALAWVAVAGRRPGRAVVATAIAITLVVALSRLYLQVHFPSDVLVGMIAGAGWVAGLCLLLRVRP